MKKATQQITALIIAEITGTITHQEQEQLNKLISRYPQIAALHHYLHENASHIKKSQAVINEQQAYEIIKISEQRIRSKKLKIVVSVAMAACLLGAVSFVVKKPNHQQIKQLPAFVNVAYFTVPSLLVGGDTLTLSGKRLLVDPVKGFIIDNVQTLAALKIDYRNTEACLIVPPGFDKFTVVTSDSTEVMLNADSQFRFPIVFNEGSRSVRLQGQAFFKVAANVKRPFMVNLPNAIVNVLGTEFNVESHDSMQCRVSLFSGEATVSSGKDKIALKKGYAAEVKGNKIDTIAFDPNLEAEWRNPTFMLKEVSPEEVIDIAYRYFRTKVIIEHLPDGAKMRGEVDPNDSIQSFLEKLGVKVENIRKDSNGVYYIKL